MRGLFLFFCVLALTTTCHAHDPKLSSIQLIRGPHKSVISVSTHLTELGTRQNSRDIDSAIRARLKLQLDGRDYMPGKSHITTSSSGLISWQAVYIGAAKRMEVSSPLYPEDALAHTAVMVLDDGRVSSQSLLDSAHPAFAFSLKDKVAESAFSVFAAYLRQGMEHILIGYDHVLFVLGLLLFGGTLKSLFKTVTAFTLAHSITLSLVVLGFWSPSSRVVEPLIALSIVAIAAENLFASKTEADKPRRDWRPLLAFAFGLVHGAGFAGALVEVGLPRANLGWALAAFNIGVEMGQASIILVAWPLLQAVSKRSQIGYGRLVTAGSLAIAAAGAFWFTQRVLGA